MQDFRIDRVSARVKLGPFSFTISQDEVAEEEIVYDECPSCHAHCPRLVDRPKYKFCPDCATPLENP